MSRTSHPAVAVAALAVTLVLGFPGPAAADVVIHDGGVSKDREAATWVKDRTGASPTRVLDPDDVLRGPSRLLLSGAEVERCEGRPVAIDAAGKLDQITDRVLSFDLEAALESIRVLDTLLPCSDVAVPARELARLSFLRGAAQFDKGDEQAAGEAMLEAAALDPSYEGELGFPGVHTELLATMRAGAATSPTSHLYLWTPSGSGEILVDGAPVEQIRKQGKELPQGLHLVQIAQDDGLSGMWVRMQAGPVALVFPETGRRLWADGGRSPGGELALRLLLEEVFQGKDGDVHLIHYRARMPMAATFPADGAARVAWAETEPPRSTKVGSQDDRGPGRRPRKPVKEPKADDEGTGDEQAAGETPGDEPAGDEPQPDETLVVTDTPEQGADEPTTEPEGSGDAPAEGDEPTTSDPTEGGDEPAPAADTATDGTSATTDRPSQGAGPKLKRFRIAVTVGYQYAHPFSYGMLGLDVTVGIWGPIQAGLYVRPSYGGNKQFPGMPEVVGPVIFMPMGLAAGVRKEGWLSPYVNGAFQFAYNRDGLRALPFLVGAMVQGGLDISPGDGFFVIRVQGEAGILGQVFNGRVSAGVGVRF